MKTRLARAALVLAVAGSYLVYVFELSHAGFWTSGIGDWMDPVLHQRAARTLVSERDIPPRSVVAADVLSGAGHARVFARARSLRSVLWAGQAVPSSVPGLQRHAPSGRRDGHAVPVRASSQAGPEPCRSTHPDRVVLHVEECDQWSHEHVGAAGIRVPHPRDPADSADLVSSAGRPPRPCARVGGRPAGGTVVRPGLLHRTFRGVAAGVVWRAAGRRGQRVAAVDGSRFSGRGSPAVPGQC